MTAITPAGAEFFLKLWHDPTMTVNANTVYSVFYSLLHFSDNGAIASLDPSLSYGVLEKLSSMGFDFTFDPEENEGDESEGEKIH